MSQPLIPSLILLIEVTESHQSGSPWASDPEVIVPWWSFFETHTHTLKVDIPSNLYDLKTQIYNSISVLAKLSEKILSLWVVRLNSWYRSGCWIQINRRMGWLAGDSQEPRWATRNTRIGWILDTGCVLSSIYCRIYDIKINIYIYNII